MHCCGYSARFTLLTPICITIRGPGFHDFSCFLYSQRLVQDRLPSASLVLLLGRDFPVERAYASFALNLYYRYRAGAVISRWHAPVSRLPCMPGP